MVEVVQPKLEVAKVISVILMLWVNWEWVEVPLQLMVTMMEEAVEAIMEAVRAVTPVEVGEAATRREQIR